MSNILVVEYFKVNCEEVASGRLNLLNRFGGLVGICFFPRIQKSQHLYELSSCHLLNGIAKNKLQKLLLAKVINLPLIIDKFSGLNNRHEIIIKMNQNTQIIVAFSFAHLLQLILLN